MYHNSLQGSQEYCDASVSLPFSAELPNLRPTRQPSTEGEIMIRSAAKSTALNSRKSGFRNPHALLKTEKNPMRQSRLLVLLALIGICSISLMTGRSDETADKAAAVKRTETWLGLIDSRKYGESWDEAAELFKKHVSREQWEKLIDATRSPFGKLLTKGGQLRIQQDAPRGTRWRVCSHSV